MLAFHLLATPNVDAIFHAWHLITWYTCQRTANKFPVFHLHINVVTLLKWKFVTVFIFNKLWKYSRSRLISRKTKGVEKHTDFSSISCRKIISDLIIIETLARDEWAQGEGWILLSKKNRRINCIITINVISHQAEPCKSYCVTIVCAFSISLETIFWMRYIHKEFFSK